LRLKFLIERNSIFIKFILKDNKGIGALLGKKTNKDFSFRAETVTKKTINLYGKNSVYERLKVNPKSIHKIFLDESFNQPNIESLILKYKIPYQRISSSALSKICTAKDLQGIVALVDDFRYADFDYLLLDKNDNKKTIIFLDRINDPHNLGVIIRTAACFGGFSIVIPKFNSCQVNQTVMHVASGGENYIPVSMVVNLANAIIKAKKAGYWVVGAVVKKQAQDINKVSFNFPLSLVLGSEGEGIRYGIERYFDYTVKIPMYGTELSFNVAMACAIFCYEITKQKVSQINE